MQQRGSFSLSRCQHMQSVATRRFASHLGAICALLSTRYSDFCWKASIPLSTWHERQLVTYNSRSATTRLLAVIKPGRPPQASISPTHICCRITPTTSADGTPTTEILCCKNILSYPNPTPTLPPPLSPNSRQWCSTASTSSIGTVSRALSGHCTPHDTAVHAR